jgi:hypothetical protein
LYAAIATARGFAPTAAHSSNQTPPVTSKSASSESTQILELFKSLGASQNVIEEKLSNLDARVSLIESFNFPSPPRKRNK